METYICIYIDLPGIRYPIMNIFATSNRKSNTLFGLDHLRTLAILLVFLFHYGRLFPHPEWTNTISAFGWTGVDLFFVLSGYLISAPLFLALATSQTISFKTFFLKRIFRILPAYLLIVAIYFLIPSFREREALAPLWKYLSFTQNLGLDLRTQGTFSHAWSLCIEEQFYLLLPLILLTITRFHLLKRGFLFFICLFLLGFVIRFYSWQHFVAPFLDKEDLGIEWYQWIYYPTYCRLDGLLIGVFIAALLQFKPKIKAGLHAYGNALFLLSLIVLTTAYLLCDDAMSFNASIFGFPLVGIGYGLLVLSAITPSCFLFKKETKLTKSLATLSYALYLSHKISIHVTQNQFSKIGLEADSNLIFLICLGTSIAVAWLINRLIEKPFLKIRDHVLSRMNAHIK